MIAALDHVVCVCPDIEAGQSDYSALLGVEPSATAEDDDTRRVVFRVANSAIELLAANSAPMLARMAPLLADGPRLTSLAWRLSEPELGAPPRRIPDAEMAGVKTFLLHTPEPAMPPVPAGDCVNAMDHIVLETSDAERTIAKYRDRLGLRLALDQTVPEWGGRMLFFRVGKVTLEVIARDNRGAADDHLWGITWRVADIEAAAKRLDREGIGRSPVRDGRKPGTRVMTVKSHSLEIPTLFLQAD